MIVGWRTLGSHGGSGLLTAACAAAATTATTTATLFLRDFGARIGTHQRGHWGRRGCHIDGRHWRFDGLDLDRGGSGLVAFLVRAALAARPAAFGRLAGGTRLLRASFAAASAGVLLRLAASLLVALALAALVGLVLAALAALLVATTVASTVALVPTAVPLAAALVRRLLACGRRGRDRRGGRRGLRRAREERDDAAPEPRRCGRGMHHWGRHGHLGGNHGHGRGRLRDDALDHGLLLRPLAFGLDLARAVRRVDARREFGGAFEARFRLVEARIVVAQALDVIVRRLEELVRDQHDRDAQARLELRDVRALLVQQEGGDLHRHLSVDRRRAFLHRLFLQDAQDVQRGTLGIADHADAVAARAGDVAALRQGGPQALARQFHQAEARDLAHLDARAVVVQRVLQAVLDLALVLRVLHVDEVDDDQAAEVAQAQLARDFIGRFQVGARRGFLDVGALGCARGVHVHGDQRLGVVDDDRAARRQRHLPRVRGLDLVLDLEAREERNVVLVALHARDVVRHHVRHELARLLVDVVGVDQDLADLGMEVVADRADDEVGFLDDQERGRVGALQALAVRAGIAVHVRDLLLAGVLRVIDGEFELRPRGVLDRMPQLEQVVQVPLQFLGAAADARSAGDDGHAGRHLQPVHRVAQFLPVLALDPARDAAAARVVRHQHEVAAGERDERGQGRALVAALFLLDLDDQLLAFAQGLLDARRADIHAVAEVGARHFLERQEPVPLLAVIDEARFEARLDAGDDPLVDVRLALLAASVLDVDVDQPLAVDDGHAQFFRVRGVEQHAFHSALLAPSQGRSAG